MNPALMPWSKRPSTSGVKPCAKAIIGMLMTNRTPLMIIIFLRPSQSDNMPEKIVEMTLPASTAATMKESWPAVSDRLKIQNGWNEGEDWRSLAGGKTEKSAMIG